MIKLANAPALIIATFRLNLAILIITPYILTKKRSQLSSLTRRDLILSLVAGIFLSIHFITWVSSLKFTSVASSVVFVSTNPIFVGLGSRLILKEKLSRLLVTGILLSITGGVLIGYGDFTANFNELLGVILALLGALSVSGYLLIGRKVRQKNRFIYLHLRCIWNRSRFLTIYFSFLGAKICRLL